MMQRRTTWLSIMLLIALLSTGAATGFSVQVTPIEDTILPLETAKYEVIIKNDRTYDDVIKISADTSDWIISPQAVSLTVNATEEVVLLITPRSGVGLSNYRIPLTFEGSRSGQVIEESVFLSLGLDLLTKGYPANVRLNVTADQQADPRQPYEVSVFLRNYNLRDYQNLTVSVKSDIFSDSTTIALEPLATYRKKFLFDLDPYQDPGKHDLKITLTLADGTVISQEESVVEIQAHATLQADRAVIEKGLLRSLEVITITNDGNRELTKEVTYEVSALEDIFLTATPKGEVVKDVKAVSDAEGNIIRTEKVRKLSWTPTLQPQETQEIQLQRNYVPLAIVILAIILAVIAYFKFRSPIISLKEAQITAADKEGVREMKIRVFVKNRSRQTVNKIRIIDRVPHIAEFISNTHLGTLQPTKVTKSEKRGTIVRWEIEALEPYEERIISYKVKSRLKIVGRMSLPETRIKFEQNKGHERVVGSGPSRMVR